MDDRKLKRYLRQSLGAEIQPERLEETVKFCRKIVESRGSKKEEPSSLYI